MSFTRVRRMLLVASTLSLGLAGAVPARAQDDATAAIKAETARIEADTGFLKARTAQIEALKSIQLPSQSGTTELKDNAGTMEATLLASQAAGSAASMIANAVQERFGDKPVIILAGDEALDLSASELLVMETEALGQAFAAAGVAAPTPRPVVPTQITDRFYSISGAGTAAGAVATVINAVTGLVSVDTSISGREVGAVTPDMLALAVSSRLAPAISPARRISSGPGAGARKVYAAVNALAPLRLQAAGKRKPLLAQGEKLAEPGKTELAELNSAIARYDAFHARVTTADASGRVPLVAAARMADLAAAQPRVLRVFVDKAGGTVITRRSLLTRVGQSDPTRVTGALIASYQLTDPMSGKVEAGDLIGCHTALARLSEVHGRSWRQTPKAQPGAVTCRSMLPAIVRASGSRAEPVPSPSRDTTEDAGSELERALQEVD